MSQPHKGGTPAAPRPGLLTRLAKDVGGNTFAIVGAALIPLTAMVGSGVDMSRAYMAKTRLQSACDAAALAGRRVMRNDTLTAEVTDEANRFFSFNFRPGFYGTSAFTPQVTRPSAGTVRVAANTTIPTTIMSMFGVESLPLDVTCDASLNMVNTDIVLILDVTGSMLCTPEESGSCGRTSEISTSRVAGLRQAVMALYDELEPIQQRLEAAGMRLRFAIVPYSSAVNVGYLIRDVSPAYLRTNPLYQSRRVVTTAPNAVNESTCEGSSYRGTYNRATRVCTYFNHERRSIDTSQYITGASVNLTPVIGGSTPISTQASNSTPWSGCIEERQTVDTISSNSGLTIPAGAFDLDINRIPDSDATRWAPHWPEVIFSRAIGSTSTTSGTRMTSRPSAYYACPSPARRLQAWTRAAMQNYVDDLIAIGGTYHDIGMIWGARMLSPAGIFGDSPDTFNNMPVARHIIYMTDGQLAANTFTYTSYGLEQHDRRVTGTSTLSDANLTSRHMQRFNMICNATKRTPINASVWVVAFATQLSNDLINCASNPSQASLSSSNAQLISRFRELGTSIGALRLTQ